MLIPTACQLFVNGHVYNAMLDFFSGFAPGCVGRAGRTAPRSPAGSRRAFSVDLFELAGTVGRVESCGKVWVYHRIDHEGG